MKRIFQIAIILFFIFVVLSLPTSAQDTNGLCISPLIAGKENLITKDFAGTVAVYFESGMLIIEFKTHDGWVLQETHLYVGVEAPATSAPGRFPYKHDLLENSDTDTYEIDLEENNLTLDNEIIYFAAHAAMQLIGPEGDILEEESAWALGDPIREGKNWAMYFRCTGGENGGDDVVN
ncbi:MAG: hypothetical protein ACMUIS_11985 [bacterium]